LELKRQADLLCLHFVLVSWHHVFVSIQVDYIPVVSSQSLGCSCVRAFLQLCVTSSNDSYICISFIHASLLKSKTKEKMYFYVFIIPRTLYLLKSTCIWCKQEKMGGRIVLNWHIRRTSDVSVRDLKFSAFESSCEITKLASEVQWIPRSWTKCHKSSTLFSEIRCPLNKLRVTHLLLAN
jgi:hypothetical protein